MESEYFTIHVHLGKMTFPITIKRVEEEMYRAAERLVNERMNFYATRYQHQGYETYMAMAMMDIALSLKKNEKRNDTQPFVNSIAGLLGEIEETLERDK